MPERSNVGVIHETVREVTELRISAIRREAGLQPREGINSELVAEYMQVLDALPPVIVFYDGTNYWLADGYHRAKAFESCNRLTIPVDIRMGDKRAAQLYSLGANATHGSRRTNADKRRAVMAMLHDAEWSKWSDGRIAEYCRVTQPFVGQLRKAEGNPQVERTYTHKSGKVTTMQVKPIASRASPKPISKNSVTVDFRNDDWELLKSYAKEVAGEPIKETIEGIVLEVLYSKQKEMKDG